MDFSAVHEQQQSALSADGSVVVGAAGYRLLLRHPLTLALLQVYNCVDAIDKIEPSPDGQHVLCVISKKGVTQVWSVHDSQWTCRIDEGLAGLETALWVDERHVLTVAGFALHATIWSLVDRSNSRIPSPKHAQLTATAHKAGTLNFLAVASRRECKDHMAVYELPARNLCASFPLATADLADFAWGPRDASVLVWDYPVECLLLVYSLRGEQLQRFDFYTGALGVKLVAFSPGRDMVAVGCFNQELRFLNATTWTEAATCAHSESLVLDAQTVVYREEALGGPVASHVHRHGGETKAPVTYVAQRVESRGELHIPSVKAVVEGQPKIGVGLGAWSTDARFFACRNDNQPLAAYIWDSYRLALAAVCLHRSPVSALAWDPSPARKAAPRLLVATRERRVFLWSEASAQVVDVPAALQVGHAFWRLDGLAVLLASRSKVVAAFPAAREDAPSPDRSWAESAAAGSPSGIGPASLGASSLGASWTSPSAAAVLQQALV